MDNRRSTIFGMPPPKTPRFTTQQDPPESTTRSSYVRFGDTVRHSRAPRYSANRNRTTLGGISSMRPSMKSIIPGSGRQLVKLAKPIMITHDPRNLRDKEVKKRICDRIIDYLASVGAPLCPTPQALLLGPTAADFKKVLEFLIQQLQLGPLSIIKLEEDVPKVMEILGYPYAIKKSTIQSLGAMHSWPQLLGLLDWLLDFIEFTQQNPARELTNAHNHKFVTDCYKKATSADIHPDDLSNDFFKPELEAFRRTVICEDTEQELNLLRADRVSNEEKIVALKEKFKTETAEIEQLSESAIELQAEIIELKCSIEKFQAKTIEDESELAATETQIGIIRGKILQHQNEITMLEQFVANQKITREEVQEINSRKAMLLEQRLQLDQKLAQAEQMRNELQQQSFRLTSQVQTDFEQLRGRIRELALTLFNGEGLISQINALRVDEAFNSSPSFVTQLIERFNNEADLSMKGCREQEMEVDKELHQLKRKIHELEHTIEERKLNHNQHMTTLKREHADEDRVLSELEVYVESNRRRHKQMERDAETQRQKANEMQRKTVELHKEFVEYKQTVEKKFEEARQLSNEYIVKLINQHKQLKFYGYKFVKLMQEAITSDLSRVKGEELSEQDKRALQEVVDANEEYLLRIELESEQT